MDPAAASLRASYVYQLDAHSAATVLTVAAPGATSASAAALLERPAWRMASQRIAPICIEYLLTADGGVHLRWITRRPRGKELNVIELE